MFVVGSHAPDGFFAIEELRNQLPSVGDVVYRRLTVELISTRDDRKPRRGIVTYVNKEHLWYEAEFDLGGNKVKQAFKLPELRGE